MKRLYFLVLSLIFCGSLVSSEICAAIDLTVTSVNHSGTYHYVKGEKYPVLDVQYQLDEDSLYPVFCLIGVTMPVDVQISLYQDSSATLPISSHIATHDRCNNGLNAPFTFTFPIYDRLKPFQLDEDLYHIKVTIDPENKISETSEKNNTTSSSSFWYTVYSGDVFFGNIKTTAHFNTIVRKLTPLLYPCPGSRYFFSASSGQWVNTWESSTIDYPVSGILCASGMNNSDRYSRDLIVTSGSATVPDLVNYVQGSGLEASIYGVSLDQAGMHYNGGQLKLPDGVTVHKIRPMPNSTTGVDPNGSVVLTFPAGGPVNDPAEIQIDESFGTERFFHSYGLPFYIGAKGYKTDLQNAANLTLQAPVPRYIHTDALKRIEDRDNRRRQGFPGNDVLFLSAASAGAATIDSNGLDAEIDVAPSYQVSNIIRPEFTYQPTIHFPRGTLRWGDFSLSINNGVINHPVKLGELHYTALFSGACPDGNCGDLIASAIFKVRIPEAGLTSDGSFGGWFDTLGSDTRWGQRKDSVLTYERDDSLLNGMFYTPGFLIPETGSAKYSISQFLLGSRGFTDTATPGKMHYLNDPNDAEAARGNDYFAGLTLGPRSLVPYAEDLTPSIGVNPLFILFNGQNDQVRFEMDDHSKYVLRKGGLTGVFNTSFSGDIKIYDYTLHLTRFAFRQVGNRMDEKTLIEGSLDLPFPADIEVAFSNLNITCPGDFAGGNVETEECNGKDDDHDKLVDEGCYQALTYWNTPVDYLSMAFEDKGEIGLCPNPNERALKLNTRNAVSGLDSTLTLSSFWNPNGSPEQDKITGNVETTMDSPDPLPSPDQDQPNPGFSLQVRDGYLSHPENGSYSVPQPVKGFTNLISTVNVPLFDAIPVHGHFENSEVDEKGQTDPDKFSLHVFKDESDMDAVDKDGVPSLYGNLDEYRNIASKRDESLSPDPRPRAQYSWPSSELIELDYPLIYNRSVKSEPPSFLGIKQKRDFFGATPVISVYSVPDYLKPLRTKLSFGVSADVAALENFHFDLGELTGDLDAFLQEELGVGISIESLLSDLVTSSELMHSVTGGNVSDLIEQGLDAALESSQVSGGIDNVVDIMQEVHSAPALISSQFEDLLTSATSDISSMLTSGLTKQLDNLHNTELVTLVKYSPEQIDAAIANGLLSDPGNLEELRNELATLKADLNSLTSILVHTRESVHHARSALADLRSQMNGASSRIALAITEVESGLNNLNEYTSTNQEINPILLELQTARGYLDDVRNAIDSLNLGTIGQALQSGAQLAGGSIDTTLLSDAERFFQDRIDELDRVMSEAENHYLTLLGSAGLDTLFSSAISRLATLESNVKDVRDKTEIVFSLILDSSNGSTPDGGYLTRLDEGLCAAIAFMHGFESDLDTLADIDLPPSASWSTLTAEGQERLNRIAWEKLGDLAVRSDAIGQKALDLRTNLTESSAFNGIFINNLLALLEQPIKDATGGFSGQLQTALDETLSFIPAPDSDDIRELIKNAILNSDVVQSINDSFFAQFGFISDYTDDLIGQLTGQINQLINGTIEAVNEALNEQIASITSEIGGAGGGLAAAKIDGYGIVSQDELERFHLEAEFTFAGDPDPTVYFAGLDIASWNAENGKGAACPEAASGNGLIDVSIFTRDITASMLGTSLGLKEALLGFTLDGPIPIGMYGYVYTLGELDFESLVLSDMGLEAGVGAIENYLGAKATGRFDSYQISAAFYAGKSCDYTILKRLDPEVAHFLGERDGLTGIYARGSAEVPIYNYSCALRVGVGADVGAWYFADPPPTYGGLLGGSAYGQVACLASLKGKVTLIGAKVGSQYNFSGSGWGAGGVGWCSPSSWDDIGDSRSDSWCLTGDATFGATYKSNWSIDGPNVSCCH